jgi:hypothetical protein
VTWEDELFRLFDDLEGQAAASFALDREAELADRRRAEYQQVSLAGRLMASVGREIGLDVMGLGTISGTLERVATGWLLLRGRGQDWVVREAAVTAVRGASERAVPAVAWPVAARLGLTSALRRIADAGERCVVHGTDGRAHDATVRRVGADFVELVVGEAGQLVLVPYATLAAVQSRD